MKPVLAGALVLLTVGLLAFVFVYRNNFATEEATGSLTHVSNIFQFVVHAPYPDAARLFGPEGERVWAHDNWNPRFLYPQSAQDVEGAVFTVRHGAHSSIWVNTAMNIDDRHFQYVYFIPGSLVTTIDVRFNAIDSDSTRVTVKYDRTALNVQANKTVRHLGEADGRNGPEWESAVNNYLARRQPR